MIDMNIKFLRNNSGMSQEELAEKIGVSRQSVAKWENGESLPDIMKCNEIANLFDTSIDNLVNFPLNEETIVIENESDDGKYVFGIVKVGERGQVVIPKYAREIFGISHGDKLLVLGDKSKGGIALAKVQGLRDFFK